MNKIFRWIAEWIRNTEHTLITFVAAVIPWLVPAIPAYLTGYHVVNQLKLPWWAGWIIGAIVEGLGLASMSRTVAFWENNRKYVKDVKKMPLLVPLATYVWYLVIVIAVNVLLEKEAGASTTRILVIGLLATLSVPTAALISVNSIWTERLLERDQQRLERQQKVSESSEETSESLMKVPEVSESFPKDWRKLRPLLKEDEIFWFANVKNSEFSAIAERYRISEKTVSNWRAYARAELKLDEA